MACTYAVPDTWWGRVDIQGPDDCWLWKLSVGSHGYGQTWDGKRNVLAHRVAWSLTRGPIPEDLTIDHICRVRRCCNPRHLRLMTNEANAANNGNAIKTSCLRGHRFDEANTYRTPRGHRRCRKCERIMRQRSRIRRWLDRTTQPLLPTPQEQLSLF